MSRKLTAIVVSSAIGLSATLANAQAQVQSAPDKSVVSASAAAEPVKNQSPLPAGGAAGIQQAQGMDSTELLIVGGVLVAAIVAAILLNTSGGSTSATQ